MKTIKIKELGIEVQTKISQKGKSFHEIKIPKGWRLLRTGEIIFLYNNHRKELNLEYAWEHIAQPFKLNKENDYCAWFVAGSDWADLDCGRSPSGSVSGLGVRFCRDLNKEEMKKCG
jgi:hypothetical protein